MPGAELVGRRYGGPVFELADREPGGAFPSSPATSSPPRTAPASSTSHPPSARTTTRSRPRTASSTRPATAPSTTRSASTANSTGRVGGFEGRFVKDPEVTKALIADLAARGLLFREQVYEHAYPHCWRCDTPLLYYAKSSWYVATSQVREQMLANNETIGWHPEHIKHGRFGKWLENNVDWALSRDRYWGTPLPIWECAGEDCDGRFCAGSVAELRERAQRRGPRRPAPPLHRRGRRSTASSAGARCAGSSR